MKPLALSIIIFSFVLGGIFLGMLLRRALPRKHLSKDAQDVVRLGIGLIANHSRTGAGSADCGYQEFV